MADKLREFEAHLVDGKQTVTIVDVLVFDSDIYLLLQGKREKPHVLKIRPSGLVVVPGAIATIVEALHQEEVESWLEMQSRDLDNS